MSKETRSITAPPATERRFINGRNGGKRREVFVPNAAMREVHAQVIRETRLQLGIPSHNFGGVRGGSAVRCAMQHWGNHYVYKLDLYNAYPSVRPEWLYPVLAEVKSELWVDQVGMEDFVRRYLATPRGRGLMTGTPAATDLFNQVAARKLDEALIELAERWSLTYTRYIDDLVFSSWEPIGRRKREAIRAVIKRSGFRLNYKKTGYYDVARRPVMITGLRLGAGPSAGEASDDINRAFAIYLPRKWLQGLEGSMYCLVNGKSNRVGKAIEPGVVEGRMGALREHLALGGFPFDRQAALVWRKYTYVKPITRPKVPLSPMEEWLQRLFRG
ncbi:hypothetical protein EPO04_01480 [Patescibacteria group bacterium]|nr:MAG: hypothetical protein EPO04_01480 [Patescibacteria group bacterium]